MERNRMDNLERTKTVIEDTKTMVEYQNIIVTFRATGRLNREDAIHKYKEFNRSHPEYIAAVNLQGTVFHNVAPMDTLSDWDIVMNLNRQLMYLGGKNLLEGLQNG